MGLVNKILEKFVGSKADRDIKEILPLVDKTKEVYEKLSGLSNDELRQKAADLRIKVKDYTRPDEKQIIELKEKAESGTLEISETEAIYNEVDRLTKTIDEKIEKVLEEILPDAFAVVKETARRFTENETLEVSANDFATSFRWPQA